MHISYIIINGTQKNNELATINNRLKQLLSARQLSIRQLAKLSGVAVGTIQKMVTDPHCNPTIASIAAITKVLDVPISFCLVKRIIHHMGNNYLFLSSNGTN